MKPPSDIKKLGVTKIGNFEHLYGTIRKFLSMLGPHFALRC